MSVTKRPASAGSNVAWENEDRSNSRQEIVEPEKTKGKDECGSGFQRALKAVWMTRLTVDTDDNRDLYIKTTLRELVIYCLFLAVICIITFGMVSTNMYYFTQVMTGLFQNTPDENGVNFDGISSMSDFWDYTRGPLLDGLYQENWYNGQNVTGDQQGFIFYENKILGVPRLRQVRVRNDSCTVTDDFKDQIKTCYAGYSGGAEDTSNSGINGTAWTYQSEEELETSSSDGQVATYGGGGYVQDLSLSREVAGQYISDLFNNLWVDRGTRAVIIDFTVYNANINLFCVIKLIVEFPPTGGAFSKANYRTVKLLRYVSSFDYFVLFCEFLLCLFIFYYIVEEILEIKKNKLKYFKSFWNILDIVVISIAVCCIAYDVYRYMAVNEKLNVLLQNPNTFADFDFLSYCQMSFNNALAVMVFCAWVKIFKYISFNKTMTQLSSTLSRCAKDLAGFAVMFFIIFFAFAQLGFLLFGTQVQDFNSFMTAIFSLFRIILGDFNFQALQAANRVLGPLYFVLYVFFVFFVLLNMFLAIINDTYSEVKDELAQKQSEIEVTDFLKNRVDRLLEKTILKKNKPVDINKVTADRPMSREELRHELKMHGYSEVEIEAHIASTEQPEPHTNEAHRAPSESGRRSLNNAGDRDGSRGDDETDSELEQPNGVKTGKTMSGIQTEEFTVLTRRVDRMEHSIGSIVSKIDAVLVKLEIMERAKAKRRETMTRILDSITEQSSGKTDAEKREQMESLVREELDTWDDVTPARAASATARSRPSTAVRESAA